ncbi:hypothetical protein PISL3812_05893 [Talaromyces islandicus]|uniref:Uncharacterized protein n=1 Tax=Talaromyces islandicus TaxID=28573 RepID=A0A0U1LZX8_TALIS|nr:hypothetical protein PISL3812_05893 [Talaromyces islandicus]
MPTVAMTSELEEYIDSLRSYLNKNPDVGKSMNSPQNDRNPVRMPPKAGAAHDAQLPSPDIVENNVHYRRMKMAPVVSTQKN